MNDTEALRRAVTTPNTEVFLRDFVTQLDCMAQQSTRRAYAMCAGALALLMAPDVERNLEPIADLLSEMCEVTDDLRCNISARADEIGAAYIDKHRSVRISHFAAVVRGAGGAH